MHLQHYYFLVGVDFCIEHVYSTYRISCHPCPFHCMLLSSLEFVVVSLHIAFEQTSCDLELSQITIFQMILRCTHHAFSESWQPYTFIKHQLLQHHLPFCSQSKFVRKTA
jgi:hypothetical protein